MSPDVTPRTPHPLGGPRAQPSVPSQPRVAAGASMTAQVVRVESDSEDQSWTIQVARGTYFERPDASDVPADIREALSAWLAEWTR